ncbi:C4-dicarboxylate ABC transporter [Proteus mirabilis]|nr:C4-dicarboxylate transporter DcuC [Proteus mirabilis]MBS3827249.1 C4-dicarboxylate transporter DcuC [Proteus mirabilis]MBS3838062.1 C4-dicarboxylate transporter DcuC [Proteus mirabilis]MDC9788164.1 C4-dicarboxylate transporter DcuC [Proteus mirabilis]RQW16027.1 C4-dicarboxylate ABC transporter [Proteus mirabilis]
MVLLILGIVVLGVTIFLLIKQFDTRTVLIGSGILLCFISLTPLSAFQAFSERMVTGALIQSICSSMGFAFVMKYTKCDLHLVRLLTKPMKQLGVFLIPLTVIVTFLISIAIPSAAGVSAAAGATLIPLLIASRIHPAIAAGTIITGTIGATLNPGIAHNAQISSIAKVELIDFVIYHAPVSVCVMLIGAFSLMMVAIMRKEINLTPEQISAAQDLSDSDSAPAGQESGTTTHLLWAIAPFIPVILLIASSFGAFGATKINVPTAMILGALYALAITRSSPKKVTTEFFNGMGSSYANILGIIIAAAVFIEGLKACGLIDSFIQMLINEPNLARWGGSIGPFLMGIVTGTGDATAFSFNEAVTPHADKFGYMPENLGAGVMYAACLGRNMSPLAGATIVCAGLARINPMEIAKRNALGMVLSVLAVALIWMGLQ